MDMVSVMAGALRYEFFMQVRRRSIWLVIIFVSVLSGILWLAFISGADVMARDAVLYLAEFTAWFLPVGVGLVLADRLARDKKLHVDEILDTYSASLGARLLGKYLGGVLATLVPVILIYLFAISYILARFHDAQSILLALETFATIPLPGILFASGFSVAFPAFLKVPLYQLLFIGYWFWANLMSPRFHIPTLTGTMLNATGPWAEEAFFHFQWVFLRLHATVWQGIASIVLLIGVSLLAICGAWLYLRWEQARR